MTRSNVLEIEPLSPAIGAVLRGVNLAEPASDDLIGDIRAALLRHQVIFFEGQDFTPTQQRDFAARFGDLHVHPLYDRDEGHPEIMIIDNHVDNPTDNNFWHTDVTFIDTPPMGSILAARQLPPVGGDTMWASMTAAYKALSKPMQTFLQGLEAVHDFSFAFTADGLAGSQAGREKYEKAVAANPPVTHPVIRTHPETGEPGIFVNSVFTRRIKGLRREESRALMAFLNQHIQQPEFVVRWRWRPGDVAFWDNRNTQHRAVDDFLPHRRIMTRATVLGDKPVFAA
ncbi:taurine dioxygenase [Caulobacter sp. NIBR1757]|uniref:taurine dioxygenase n=1 Tax=Caulobacter sp. NIBR1757 TaxID=3016000 RepID=UPI0022F06C30|nr:taurine dioxygenase [Caulobacter sp. NIBR1757]WGM39033.1 Alpha-ketoglutarate-dependent taurine dioxygenase [Caulobacter sp. NIBR1757]